MRKIHIKLLTLLLGVGGFLASCSDRVDIGSIGEGIFQNSDKTLSFLSDKYGKSQTDTLFFNNEGSVEMFVNLNKAADRAFSFSLAYDAAVLEKYNKEHGTSLEPLPENLVTIGQGATVDKNSLKSSAISVSYKTDTKLKENAVYAIPLSVKSPAGVETSKEGNFVLVLRDITKMPNCHKDQKFINVAMPEINNTNPLDMLCFTLENSKKYFFDQLVLFSDNIVYDEETGDVHARVNENIRHVLDNKDKYLAPLRAKGIKVILAITPYWTRAGVTNLSEKGAKDFARYVKAMCDAYDLDGVFLDDEYDKPVPGAPGFDDGGPGATRLCYELKEALGKDRLVEVYVYKGTMSIDSYKGKKAGDFVDFAIQDYQVYSDLTNNYPGMSKKGMIQYPSECSQNRYISRGVAKNIVTEGYGGTSWFAIDPSAGRMELDIMNSVAEEFYGEKIIYDKKPYGKDW